MHLRAKKSCQICVKSIAEQFLSNNKADLCPSNNSSLKNYVLRIPGSHNSKCAERNNDTSGVTTEVRIIQKWDGNRPAINWVLRDFSRYLIQEKINDTTDERKRSRYSPAAKTASTK